MNGQVIVIWTQKGGTGKTTSAIAMAEHWALERGQPVLMIDMDGQRTLSAIYGVKATDADSVCAALNGTRPIQRLTRQVGKNLFLVPASRGLYDWDYNERGIDALRRELDPVRGRVLTVIDCGPAYSPGTKTALATGTCTVIPCPPTVQDLLALKELQVTYAEIQSEHINDRLIVAGVVLTQVRGRCRLHRAARAELEKAPFPLLQTSISQSVHVQEAAGHGQSIIAYRPRHKVAGQYRALCEEVSQCAA